MPPWLNTIDLRPIAKPRVIDLVAEAGFDVTDWEQGSGGKERASSNPKYCYEWCFQQAGMHIFNLWLENMDFSDDEVTYTSNFRDKSQGETGIRRTRTMRFDAAVRNAYVNGSNPRVIILDRPPGSRGRATARSLDASPWTVVDYDFDDGGFRMVRGISPVERVDGDVTEGAIEGRIKEYLCAHRSRERKLRTAKLEVHKSQNAGRLVCEVPNCGFDFAQTYGPLGADYAQVHHLWPLGKSLSEGRRTTLKDLIVICANCHAMVHRGGECRDFKTLIPAPSAARK